MSAKGCQRMPKVPNDTCGFAVTTGAVTLSHVVVQICSNAPRRHDFPVPLRCRPPTAKIV